MYLSEIEKYKTYFYIFVAFFIIYTLEDLKWDKIIQNYIYILYDGY
jgi:hypothetical protein